MNTEPERKNGRGRPCHKREGIGARLYQLRKQLHLTTIQAGERWGIKRNTLCDYERGRIRLPAEVLGRIAERENITADWILGRTDEWRPVR